METEIKEEQLAMLPSCKADTKSKLQKEMKKYSPIIEKRQSRVSLPLSSLLHTGSLVGLVFNSLSKKAGRTGVSYVANSEVLTHVCCVCSRGFLVSSLETIRWQIWLCCAKSNGVLCQNIGQWFGWKAKVKAILLVIGGNYHLFWVWQSLKDIKI